MWVFFPRFDLARPQIVSTPWTLDGALLQFWRTVDMSVEEADVRTNMLLSGENGFRLGSTNFRIRRA